MKLYLLTQTKVQGYDTFDSVVVAAESAKKAQKVHPYDRGTENDKMHWDSSAWPSSSRHVVATLLGTAKPNTPSGVICASFNAG